MHALRRLIIQIHRRSLWQVLAIYLAGSWILIQVVDTLAQLMNLPSWAPRLALFLLIIGLPIVLATAFVQDGVSSGGRGRPDLGRTVQPRAKPRQAAPTMPATHRLLTWRNAMLGGLCAFALWGVVAAAYLGTGSLSDGPSAEAQTTLAVLPFENQGDPADAYFADGMADDVRSRLAALPRLRVIAHGSVERYRDTGESPEAIAHQLGATHLLTARVRWDRSTAGPSRVRVTPELVEVGTDGRATVMWQTTVDAVLQDVFRVQAEIATKVSQGLDLVFGAEERDRLAARLTEHLEAYDAYLRGTELVRRLAVGDVTGLRRAVEHFEQAVALDPDFADAWAALSQALVSIWVPVHTREVRDRAAAAARRAVEVGPERAAPHAAMAIYLHAIEGDAVRAAEAAERALRVAPGDPDLLVTAALIDIALDHADRAITRLDLARTLDPLNASVARRRAITLLSLRRHDEALADAERAVALVSDDVDMAQKLVMVHLARGDTAAARAFLRDAAHQYTPARLAAYFGVYYDLYWILDDAQQRLLLTLPPASVDDDRGAWALVRAQLYAHRGETAAARAWADTAAREFTAQIRANPTTPYLSVYLGLAHAYAGRAAEAIEAGEEGLSLGLRDGRTASTAYYEHHLARIYLMAGRHEQALDLLESLLRTPYHVSPGWLRVDPNFDPLRAHPRFQRLAEAP